MIYFQPPLVYPVDTFTTVFRVRNNLGSPRFDLVIPHQRRLQKSANLTTLVYSVQPES